MTPEYYIGNDGRDVFKVVDNFNLSFARGCALKYLVRAGAKPHNDVIEDLRKAIDCIEREIADIAQARQEAELDSEVPF